MVLALLRTIVCDIMMNKDPTKCSERRELILKTLAFFEESFGVATAKMKDMAIETIMYVLVVVTHSR